MTITYPIWIDFCASAGNVSHDASARTQTAITADYPQSFNNTTVGWEQAMDVTLDNSTTADPRLCGSHYCFGATGRDYRIDVDSGTYLVEAAFGDAASGRGAMTIKFKDNTSATTIVNAQSTSSAQWYDSGGTLRTSSANWASNEVQSSFAVTSGTFRCNVAGSSGQYGVISHLKLSLAGTNINLTGAHATAAAGSVTETFDYSKSLTGASATATAGTGIQVIAGQTVTLTGAAAVAQAGSVTETFSANVSPTGAAAVSAAGAPSVVAGTIAITELVADRIYQRVGTAKSVTFSGTYTGTVPTGVQVQLIDSGSNAIVQAFTSLTSFTASGGVWSGLLSVPQYLGYYKWQAQLTILSTIQTAVSTNKFGVGALIAMIGQSNMEHLWFQVTAPGAASANTRRYNGNGYFAISAAVQTGELENSYENGNGGGGVIAYANAMVALLGVNVCLLEYAEGGTSITQWQTGQDPWKNFAGPTPALAGIKTVQHADVGGDFEATCWDQGETDAANGMSKATYKADFAAMQAAIITITGRATAPIFIWVLGWYAAGTEGTDAQLSTIRSAHLELIDGVTVFHGGSAMDATLIDGVHRVETRINVRPYATPKPTPSPSAWPRMAPMVPRSSAPLITAPWSRSMCNRTAGPRFRMAQAVPAQP